MTRVSGQPSHYAFILLVLRKEREDICVWSL